MEFLLKLSENMVPSNVVIEEKFIILIGNFMMFLDHKSADNSL
jgi:hypothetical protein